MFVTICKTAQYYNPEDHNQQKKFIIFFSNPKYIIQQYPKT
jgi:hypothetical protein